MRPIYLHNGNHYIGKTCLYLDGPQLMCAQSLFCACVCEVGYVFYLQISILFTGIKSMGIYKELSAIRDVLYILVTVPTFDWWHLTTFQRKGELFYSRSNKCSPWDHEDLQYLCSSPWGTGFHSPMGFKCHLKCLTWFSLFYCPRCYRNVNYHFFN